LKFFINPKLLGDFLPIEEIKSAFAIQSDAVFHFDGKKITDRLDFDQSSLPSSIAILSHSMVKKYPINQVENFKVKLATYLNWYNIKRPHMDLNYLSLSFEKIGS